MKKLLLFLTIFFLVLSSVCVGMEATPTADLNQLHEKLTTLRDQLGKLKGKLEGLSTGAPGEEKEKVKEEEPMTEEEKAELLEDQKDWARVRSRIRFLFGDKIMGIFPGLKKAPNNQLHTWLENLNKYNEQYVQPGIDKINEKKHGKTGSMLENLNQLKKQYEELKTIITKMYGVIDRNKGDPTSARAFLDDWLTDNRLGKFVLSQEELDKLGLKWDVAGEGFLSEK